MGDKLVSPQCPYMSVLPNGICCLGEKDVQIKHLALERDRAESEVESLTKLMVFDEGVVTQAAYNAMKCQMLDYKSEVERLKKMNFKCGKCYSSVSFQAHDEKTYVACKTCVDETNNLYRCLKDALVNAEQITAESEQRFQAVKASEKQVEWLSKRISHLEPFAYLGHGAACGAIIAFVFHIASRFWYGQ